jgi:hypothetical protein
VVKFSRLVCLVLTLLWAADARADWVAAAFLGQAHTLSSTARVDVPDRRTHLEIDADYRGESFTSPQYYGYRVMWIPDRHRWLGIEGEYIHAKVLTETGRTVPVRGTLEGVPIQGSLRVADAVQRLAMTHGLNFLLANVVLRHELGPTSGSGGRRLALAARAGLGPTVPHAESTVLNALRDQYEGGGLGAQVAGGIDVLVWRRLGAIGEYKFTWAKPQLGVAGGTAEIPSRTHHFAFGLSYRF